MTAHRLASFALCAALTLTAAPVNGATKNIWTSPAELASKPMLGTAWDTLLAAATSTGYFIPGWGSPNLANQQSRHATYCVAGGLVYARTLAAGTPNSVVRDRVRDAVIAAKRTMDEDAEYSLPGARTLGVGKQLAGYVIAADLIDLPGLDSLVNVEFRSWLSTIRTQELVNSNDLYGKTIKRTHECTNGWGLDIGASRIAIDMYLGDNADLARCDSLFKAHTNQSYFPSGSVWFDSAGGDYFIRKGHYQSTWVCTDTTSWLTISPNCLKTDAQGDTATIDGAVVTEASRIAPGGSPVAFAWPLDSDGIDYSWTALEGLFLQAELLHRAGKNSYAWGSNALKRAMDFMVRTGWTGGFQYGQHKWVPWVANHRYGTSYPTSGTSVPSWQMGWTNWTHAGTIQITVDPTVLAFSLNVSSTRTFTITNNGAGTLTVSSISVPAGRFSVTPASASILAGGGMATVTVLYNAGGAGVSSAIVTVVSDAPGSETVTVSCVASLAEGEEP